MSFIVSCAVISNHNNGVGKLLVIYPLLKHFRFTYTLEFRKREGLTVSLILYFDFTFSLKCIVILMIKSNLVQLLKQS